MEILCAKRQRANPAELTAGSNKGPSTDTILASRRLFLNQALVEGAMAPVYADSEDWRPTASPLDDHKPQACFVVSEGFHTYIQILKRKRAVGMRVSPFYHDKQAFTHPCQSIRYIISFV